MKILVTGGHGQVGSELERLCSDKDHEILLTDHQHLDITDKKSVTDYFLQHNPDICINAAAYTAVDKAEEDTETAFAVNRDGAENLAIACRDQDIPLLHISTDYVFDGSQFLPYSELDQPNPASVYGQSKWEGDQSVLRTHQKHIILRVAWVFAANGHNFVKTMLRLGAERDQLGIVSDQRGGPTWAGDIAATLLEIVDQYCIGEDIDWGVYNFIGQPAASWFDFASAIFEKAVELGLLKQAPALNAIATSDYPTPAKRPMNSVLDCSKILENFGIEQPDWHIGLEQVLQELKDNVT